MTHYKVEQQSYAALQGNYPYTPTDNQASIQDYLEDMLSQGYRLVSTHDHANGPFWIFAVDAK